jgi:putative PIN family toxin of toxin-antitoxin system
MSKLVVVDTNVFVSALRSAEGSSREILRACLQGRLQPLMGTALFTEYEDLLARETLFEGCPLDSDEREALLDAFLSVCQWTTVYYLWRPNLRDEADNHLLELAVAGNAEYLVTHNVRDFANAELYFPGVLVVTPQQLLEELRLWQP